MRSLPRFRIRDLLARDANNLDLVRLICAMLVIYGHSFAVVPSPEYTMERWDPFAWLRYEGVYSASIAVKLFFFISGLLVTNSLLTKPSIVRFVTARFLRVWPALIFVTALTAYVIGPLVSVLTPSDYFSSILVHTYVPENCLMRTDGTLPGVFLDNALPRMINGALWTLRYEIGCYLAILVVALLGGFRSRAMIATLLIVVVGDALLGAGRLFPWLGANPQVKFLPASFAVGAGFAYFKDHIVLTPALLVCVVAALLALKGTVAGPMLFFGLLFVSLLYFSALPWVRAIKLPADLSYGTFLWGFVFQQIFAERIANQSPLSNCMLALVASLIAATVSWYLVERPMLDANRRLPWRDAHVPVLGSGELVR